MSVRRSPVDPRLRATVREVLREGSSSSATMWIGFDYQVHVRVYGELYDDDVRLVERAFRYFLCWKALLHVSSYDWGRVATVLLVGGGEVYSAYLKSDEAIRWVSPSPFIEQQLHELGSW